MPPTTLNSEEPVNEMRSGVRVLLREIPWGSTRHGKPHGDRPGGRLLSALLRSLAHCRELGE